ncbi:MAG: DUF427 domain-containing protein [Longimicrobiales bacterium]|nr:DUF427 domain-containing protein [Longimicrobiales bacterium]
MHDWKWTGDERPSWAEEPGAGQESVWDYPRPPRVERVGKRVRVEHAGVVVADSDRALRVLETAGAPTFYIPREDVRTDLLDPETGTSYCEWKGRAVYHDLEVRGRRVSRAAWSYPEPTPAYSVLVDHYAFYASKLDACFVGEERARPQPGGFYGGWVTDDLAGPIKGEPGTEGW